MEAYSSLIFSHIPKCGGTSFRKLIYDSAISSGINKSEIYVPGYNGLKVDKNLNQLSRPELMTFSRSNFRIIAMHVPYNVHLDYVSMGLNPLYFSFFRDPFERFLSHYYFFYFKLGADKCKGKHLSDLPEKKRISLIKNLSNIYASYLLGEVKSGLYTDLDLLDGIKVILDNHNFCIGLLSNISQSLSKLRMKLPSWITLETDFPEENIYYLKSEYKDYISADLKDVFVEFNRLDIKLYEYIFKSVMV